MSNINKLRGLMVEKGFTVDQLAIETGINRSTLYRRMKDGGAEFTLEEVAAIRRVLGMSDEETRLIFFENPVA